jgi:hypothetical protein
MMRKGNGDDEVPESVNVLKSRRRDPFSLICLRTPACLSHIAPPPEVRSYKSVASFCWLADFRYRAASAALFTLDVVCVENVSRSGWAPPTDRRNEDLISLNYYR